jgi:signal transduction histidine kinase
METTQRAQARDSSASDPATAGSLRVLVVEDSEADFELLQMLLENAALSAHCRRIEDEPEMRAALAESSWDIVIADHRLPRFSARAALSTLQSVRPEIPLIVVSGSIGEDAAVEAMRAGADDYVMKSRLARLVPAIQRSLRAAEVRRSRADAETRFRESEARLRALAANVPGILLQIDLGAHGAAPRILYASEGATRLLELSPADMVADADALLRQIEPPDLARLRAAFLEAAPQRAPIAWEGRARSLIAQKMLWLRLVASPRPAQLGDLHVEVWDGIAIDVTALKEAEAMILASGEELRALGAHLERVKEHERERIAREIHDDIGGTLTGMRADLAWLRRRLGADPQATEKLAGLDALLDSAMDASVRIARDLRPPALDLGITGAMQWQLADFGRRTGIACSFSAEGGEVELAPDCAIAAFRIFQELLTNISKHAGASEVSVLLAASREQFALEVRDNGRGIAPGEERKLGSFGIRGMHVRAHEFGGTFGISPATAGGTLASLHMPVARRTE